MRYWFAIIWLWTSLGSDVSASPWSITQNSNRPEDLVGVLRYDSLLAMENAGLMSAYVDPSPWSGDYWPYYEGGIVKRYADPSFPASKDWRVNAEYLHTRPDNPDWLSPAEKYDLLVGDSSYSLSRAVLGIGRDIYVKEGSIEPWIGICHGWSAAAISAPRPRRPVVLIAADGYTPIVFYPSDIKALLSLFFAKADYPYRMIGRACDEKSPALDENLRLMRGECQDVDPEVWHLIVVNQVGANRQNLVLDVVYNRETWNQPIYGYTYQYFNPERGGFGTSLAAAAVPREQLTHDRYAKYRSARMRYLVGISMELTYVYEGDPSHRDTDSEAEDTKAGARYLYDLELDENGRIVGGEWYQLSHPDVVWIPERGSWPVSVVDKRLASAYWQPGTPFPRAWQGLAAEAASYAQPIGKVIEALIAGSR